LAVLASVVFVAAVVAAVAASDGWLGVAAEAVADCFEVPASFKDTVDAKLALMGRRDTEACSSLTFKDLMLLLMSAMGSRIILRGRGCIAAFG
jgi:hypothetical protein